MKFPWVAEVKKHPDGHLFPFLRDREEFKTYCNLEFSDGEKVWITVAKPSKEGTHRQFRYLFGAVYPPIAEHLGCTIIEIDGIMCRRLLTENPDSPLEYVRSKSTLDRKERAEYIDGVRREAAGFGISTPDPPTVEE